MTEAPVRTKHVVDGVLVRASPSSIDAFDSTTPFGCERRWWFESVQGMRSEDSSGQALGTAVHSCIEGYIEGNVPSDLWGSNPEAYRLFTAAKPVVDQVIEEGIVGVERWMKLTLLDVEIRGRIDIETREGILDWKTTSNFDKYAKTPGQLRKATPMVLYTKWLHEQRKAAGAARSDYTMEHVYIQTKGKTKVERVRAKITPAMLDVATDQIILTLDRMKVAAPKDVGELEPDRSKCRMCPFRSICPTESKNIMSLLNRFKTAEVKTEAPAMSVLPPDAPESKPELAALPVPGFQVEAAAPILPDPPTEAPKRGRGRPRKELNVPEATKATREAVAVPDIKYKQVTISHGATVPTVQFGGQRIDIGLVAEIDGDIDAATAEVSRKVRELLLAELEKLALTLSGPVLKP